MSKRTIRGRYIVHEMKIIEASKLKPLRKNIFVVGTSRMVKLLGNGMLASWQTKLECILLKIIWRHFNT